VLVLLAIHALAALLAPALVRAWGRAAFGVLALAPAAAFGWGLAQTGTMRGGGAVVESYPWAPQVGLEISLRLTTLPWLMLLIVSGVGALVLVYCAYYFDPDEPGLRRFASHFTGFAGSMVGVAVADDLLLLYVFWELTTVYSYLLIGHDPAKRASRVAALQALLVTTLGGLAMLVGFIMLGEHAGSYRLSAVVADLPTGGYLATALVLILVGALSKSAIFPFSFWLPAAMAAPTPVSAYLHAAAMVKAGVLLVGQLTPVFVDDPPWRAVVLACGAVTLLLGGWTALRQHDLKLLLAYGTVSQLGLLIVVLGAGGRVAALAGAALLLAHALFKAALFLIVGVIDTVTGTRDLRQLSGLGRRSPAVAVVAALAVASMAGVPPLAGFVAKEAALEAFLHGTATDTLVLAAIVAGSALTVAYGLRFLWGAFATKPDVAPADAAPVRWGFLAPAALLAAAGLLDGVLSPGVDRLLTPYAARYPATGDDYHLALWHGLSPALGLSALVLAAGALLFAVSRAGPRWQSLRSPVDGAVVYDRLRGGLDRLAVELTGATQRGSLPFYLAVILVTLVVFAGGPLLLLQSWPDQVRLYHSPLQLIAGGAVIVGAIFAARALRRLSAMIFVGITGYGTAMLFLLHGAPDLALTQFLVETVTVVLFVLVLRRLPAEFSERPLRTSRRGRIALGVVVGLVAAAMAYAAVGNRQAEPISTGFADLAVNEAGGKNVVNVILVDIRAWDTMGEISVLVAAATGVASLIYRRTAALRRRRGTPQPPSVEDMHSRWLMAGHSPEAGRQAIILQVATRLLFHTIVLFSVFLLVSGHNAPGGGFAGGLVAGLALALRYLAGGRPELNAAAPVDAGVVLGTGLFVSVGTGVAAMLLGGTVLESAVVDVHVPVLGNIHLVTSLFFDIGVYLIVVGLVIDLLRSLGAEVDRQQYNERAEEAAADEPAEGTADGADEAVGARPGRAPG
jgi:multicomponent Na+:H+ antiporter subunit A